MSRATFDGKFGASLVESAPLGPGVYRFLDASGLVLYVGKAKNLRRRLSNYRNATRKRVHRKMRILVREAAALNYETCDSEPEALLRECALIRELKPAYNVDGAFAFLYPSVGIGRCGRTTLLCFTTHPEEFAALGLRWYGCFRSRPRAKLGFQALTEVMGFIAHREKSAQLPEHPRIKGSSMVGFRRVPPELVDALDPFFSGESSALASKISRLLLSKPRALQKSKEVQANLHAMIHFFEADAARLRSALNLVGISGFHVAQEERDALFIRAAALRAVTAA